MYSGSAVADFQSEELSHGYDRFQHIKYHGKPPELNICNESSEILGGNASFPVMIAANINNRYV